MTRSLKIINSFKDIKFNIQTISFCLVWALFFFKYLSLPTQIAGNELDPSWRQFMFHAVANGLQAGEDYIFTYGPLSWLTLPAYNPALFWPKIIFSSILAAVLAFAVARLLFVKSYALGLLGMLLLLASYDYYGAVFILILYLFVFEDTSNIHKVLILFVLAVFSLTKFSFFLIILSSIFILLASRWFYKKNPRDSFFIAASFLICFLIAWTLAGQSILNLPVWIYSYLEIAGGYSEAMSVPRPEHTVEIALGTIFLVFWLTGALLLLCDFRKILKDKHIYLTLFFILYGFMQWKASFVRHLWFFPRTLPVAIFSTFLLKEYVGGKWRGALSKIFVTIGLCGSLGLYPYLLDKKSDSYATVISKEAKAIGSSLMNKVSYIFHLRGKRQSLDNRLQKKESEFSLPKIRSIVGKKSVDLLTISRQGVLMLGDWNYLPRPVFQSYSAYTPYLINRNADFFSGRDAPEYIIFDTGAIDFRFPSSEDGLSIIRIMFRYSPIIFEKNYVLLRKRRKFEKENLVPLINKKIGWGEIVNLQNLKGKILVFKADIKYSLMGKIVKFFYKPPAVYLEAQNNNRRYRYRLVPGMCKTGFVLQPFLRGRYLMAMSAVKKWMAPASFNYIKLVAENNNEDYYIEDIALTLEEIPLEAVSGK